MIALVDVEKKPSATQRATLRTKGPKVTVKEKAEPCKCCGHMVRRGIYSGHLRYWVCANAEACVARMKANKAA